MSFKKVFSNVFIILGAIIGGGLATGKELATFFCCFGSNFYLPCLISLITFIIFIKIIPILNFTNANKKIQFAFFCFRLVIASTMISALKEISNFFPNPSIAYLCLIVISFALLFVNFNGISKIFNIIIPLVFVCLVGISVVSIIKNNNQLITTEHNIIQSVINGSTYSALNLFLLLFIIRKSLNNCTKKERNISIVIISVLFAVLLLTFSYAIVSSNMQNAVIPLLIIATNINKSILFPALICILLAIISTFIGITFDLTNYINQNIKIRNGFVNNSLLFVLCLLISNLGLDYLINIGYKALGVFAIIYFIFIIIKEKITRTKASDNLKISSYSFINNFFYK